MRILIAEDDLSIAESLAYALRKSGYSVDCVHTGVHANAALTDNHFDLLILDLGLPKMDGFEVLKRVRARGIYLPIMILTARDSIDDRVKGLDLGADDYLVKPFSLTELEARIRALSRRNSGSTTPILQIGKLKFDKVNRIASIDDQRLELSAREFAMLEALSRRPGSIVGKDQLIEGACEWGEEVTSNAIEVYIHRLRRKLEKAGVKITTVRGLGYCLEISI